MSLVKRKEVYLSFSSFLGCLVIIVSCLCTLVAPFLLGNFKFESIFWLLIKKKKIKIKMIKKDIISNETLKTLSSVFWISSKKMWNTKLMILFPLLPSFLSRGFAKSFPRDNKMKFTSLGSYDISWTLWSCQVMSTK